VETGLEKFGIDAKFVANLLNKKTETTEKKVALDLNQLKAITSWSILKTMKTLKSKKKKDSTTSTPPTIGESVSGLRNKKQNSNTSSPPINDFSLKK